MPLEEKRLDEKCASSPVVHSFYTDFACTYAALIQPYYPASPVHTYKSSSAKIFPLIAASPSSCSHQREKRSARPRLAAGGKPAAGPLAHACADRGVALPGGLRQLMLHAQTHTCVPSEICLFCRKLCLLWKVRATSRTRAMGVGGIFRDRAAWVTRGGSIDFFFCFLASWPRLHEEQEVVSRRARIPESRSL